MMTFTIVVVDGGEMKSFTESDMQKLFDEQNSNIMIDVRNAVEVFLDHLSEQQEQSSGR